MESTLSIPIPHPFFRTALQSWMAIPIIPASLECSQCSDGHWKTFNLSKITCIITKFCRNGAGQCWRPMRFSHWSHVSIDSTGEGKKAVRLNYWEYREIYLKPNYISHFEAFANKFLSPWNFEDCANMRSYCLIKTLYFISWTNPLSTTKDQDQSIPNTQ